METWLNFFTPYFPSEAAVREFVERLEALPNGDPRYPAKIMMHQTQRLISIADDLPAIRRGKESLQLIFLLICAENIAKMHDRYAGEGQSRAYVRQFFARHISDDDRQVIERSFARHNFLPPLALQEIVDILYDVRCDVVHEGKYWGFHFHDGRTAMLNTDPDVIVSIRLSDFGNMVVRGCIRAINSYTPG